MLNTTLPHIEAERRDGQDENYVKLRENRDGRSAVARTNPLKTLLASVSNCSIAHWYLMPGLRFHRYRVYLALIAIASKQRELRKVLAQVLDQKIGPTAFLDFDFAWKAVASREAFGTYLDYSSPWLFPAMLLAKRPCERAMVLGSDSLGMEVVERVAKGRQNGDRRTICKRIRDGAFTSELFDVVTSLSWIARVADDIGILKRLWGAVKPGGMLLLSLPCTARAAEGAQNGRTVSAFAHRPEGRTQRLYDESMLQERIFAVAGQPRRCVVYGESNPGADRYRPAPGRNDHVYSLSDLTRVARGWQTYADLRHLPGEGVIAMKFLKCSVR